MENYYFSILQSIDFITFSDLSSGHDVHQNNFEACESMSATFLESCFCSCLLQARNKETQAREGHYPS